MVKELRELIESLGDEQLLSDFNTFSELLIGRESEIARRMIVDNMVKYL
jgi:hypothetical protein